MTTARWYGGQAEVPSRRSLSSRKASRLVGLRSALVSWNRKRLVGRAAALGHEQELVGVAVDRADLDLAGQVGAGVLLVPQRQRRHLRVPQVVALVGVEDAAGERFLVAAAGEDELALLALDDGGAGVLAHGEHAAGGDVGVLQEVERDEAVVGRGLGVVEDPRQLGQVPGPQVVGDVVHRLGGQRGEHPGLDLEERVAERLHRGHAVDVERRYGGGVGPEGQQLGEREVSHRRRRYDRPRSTSQKAPVRAGRDRAWVDRGHDRHDDRQRALPDRARLHGGGAGSRRRRKWGAQTQRAVENFPISGRPIDRRLIRALALIKAEAAAVNARRKDVQAVDKTVGDAIRAAAEPGGGRAVGRPVPRRRLPDRVGHVVEHERQRGHRHARVRAASVRPAPVHPNDQVNAVAVVERRVPDGDPPGRHRGDRRRPRPGARPPRQGAPAQGPRVRQGREVGSHPPDGRGADHARPGDGRLRDPGASRPPSACAPACPGSASCRSAAPPSAPASTRRRASAARWSSGSPGGHRPAAHRGQGPRRRPVVARRARGGVGSDPHRGGGADQDRQRHPLDGLGPAHRPRRDPPPGPAARLVDHAGQGEPGPVRGASPRWAPR